MLEVCVDSLESAVNAIRGGADELELCSSLTEGGLTPSAGLVKTVLAMANKMPKTPSVNAMIRCRTGSDFCYTAQEMETMLADVDVFKALGVNRFVFGALKDTQDVDEENCHRVVTRALPIPVTFHRAFDICRDPIGSLEKVILLGFTRILTSGQKTSAADGEAVDLIKKLLESRNKIQIMPGAGVNVKNARTFIDLGCNIVHSSCKTTKYLPKVDNSLNMGSADSEFIYVTDENIVKEMKEVIKTQ